MSEDRIPLTDEMKKRKQRAVEHTKSPEHTTIYANSAMIGPGFYDMRINFGQIIESDDEKVVIENRLCVVMSPQFAKAFLQVIQKNVKKYEDEFGTIKTLALDDEGEPEEPND